MRVKAYILALLLLPVPIDFFYSSGCPSCVKMKEGILSEVKSKYKDKIVINYHDTSNPDEHRLKLALEKAYDVTRGSIVEIFLPNEALIGKGVIEENLDEAIEEALEQQQKPILARTRPSKIDPILNKFSTFGPAVVLFAGLADGINPCAFATIVFFVSFLAINSYRKNQISYIGSTFIFAVFLTYLALGLGIFQVLKRLQFFSFWSRLIYLAIAFLALGLGVYHLIEYIIYKRTGRTKGCSLKLYNRLRSIADSRRAFIVVVILAFVNGFIIALLESACTGQVYFPTIAFVSKVPSLRIHAFLYLVLYNLAFILPLVFVFFLAYKGATSEKFTSFTERHFGGIKITYALLFFSLAILLFLS